MTSTRRFLCGVVLAAAAGCGSDAETPLPPGRVAEVIGERLEGASGGEAPLDRALFDLDAIAVDEALDPAGCAAIEAELADVCGALGVGACYAQTTYLLAHDIPRCAVRIQLGQGAGLPALYALDVTGPSLAGPPSTCGDGVLDDGEACDDGNREAWDGCDPDCATEEFEGCEAAIEARYAEAALAEVPVATWRGPRTHMMVNAEARALAAVDEATCAEAIALGTDVCHDLQEQMPFVGWCGATGERHADGCSIRFEVGFARPEPDRNVFTTALPGVLAFTIR